ncbi:hypothetical protein CLAVI_000964 [Candidatus Clavichlamydia salmonicola]|uniref:hypothetical protein n=1 Tax=Candidatus Clavichlamydia salmonicola TaxID=469812 RepID=UPI001891739D|nr:hypothetical protein [Candidatus Clavichlamydia salmonicola]MBF5051323.1 hypothetical protein [Candidatus Clavichlamydia salmonicola]
MPYFILDQPTTSSPGSELSFAIKEAYLELNADKLNSLRLIAQHIINHHAICTSVPSSFPLNTSVHNNTIEILKDALCPFLEIETKDLLTPTTKQALQDLQSFINTYLPSVDLSLFQQTPPTPQSQHSRKRSQKLLSVSSKIQKVMPFSEEPPSPINNNPTLTFLDEALLLLENTSEPFFDLEEAIAFIDNQEWTSVEENNLSVIDNAPHSEKSHTQITSIECNAESYQTLTSQPETNAEAYSPICLKTINLEKIAPLLENKALDLSQTNNSTFINQSSLKTMLQLEKNTYTLPMIEISAKNNRFILVNQVVRDITHYLQSIHGDAIYILENHIFFSDHSNKSPETKSRAHLHHYTLQTLLDLLQTNNNLFQLIPDSEEKLLTKEQHNSLIYNITESLLTEGFSCQALLNTSSELFTPAIPFLTTPDSKFIDLSETSQKERIAASLEPKVLPIKKKCSSKKTTTSGNSTLTSSSIPTSLALAKTSSGKISSLLSDGIFAQVTFSQKQEAIIHIHRAKKKLICAKFLKNIKKCMEQAIVYIVAEPIQELSLRMSYDKIELLKALYIITSINYYNYKIKGNLRNNNERELIALMNEINVNLCKHTKETVDPDKHSSILINLFNIKEHIPCSDIGKKQCCCSLYQIQLKHRYQQTLLCIDTHNYPELTWIDIMHHKKKYLSILLCTIQKVLKLGTVELKANGILNAPDQNQVQVVELLPYIYTLMQYNQDMFMKYFAPAYSEFPVYINTNKILHNILQLLENEATNHSITLPKIDLSKTTNPLTLINTAFPSIESNAYYFTSLFSIQPCFTTTTPLYHLYYRNKIYHNHNHLRHKVFLSLSLTLKNTLILLKSVSPQIFFFNDPEMPTTSITVLTHAHLLQVLYQGLSENFFYYKNHKDIFLPRKKQDIILSQLNTIIHQITQEANSLNVTLPIVQGACFLEKITALAKQKHNPSISHLKTKPIIKGNKPGHILPLFKLTTTKKHTLPVITSYTFAYSYKKNIFSAQHLFAHGRLSFHNTLTCIKSLCTEAKATDLFYYIREIGSAKIMTTKQELLKLLSVALKDGLLFYTKNYPNFLKITSSYHLQEDLKNTIALVIEHLDEKFISTPGRSKLQQLLDTAISQQDLSFPSSVKLTNSK